MKIRSATLVGLIGLAVLAGCAGSQKSRRSAPGTDLSVSFVSSAWDGEEIPIIGRCRNCGGQGHSPALRIGRLPAGADEVVVEFNDLRIPDLASKGGHGTLAMGTRGRREVVLPSVPEETMSLPLGVRSVRQHQCVHFGHKAGAYKAPCGCGQGNEYVARVMAVRRDGDRREVLAEAEIRLGFF